MYLVCHCNCPLQVKLARPKFRTNVLRRVLRFQSLKFKLRYSNIKSSSNGQALLFLFNLTFRLTEFLFFFVWNCLIDFSESNAGRLGLPALERAPDDFLDFRNFEIRRPPVGLHLARLDCSLRSLTNFPFELVQTQALNQTIRQIKVYKGPLLKVLVNFFLCRLLASQ